MKYVFIDTEGGVNVESGLKTFGFVVMSEEFITLQKQEVYIGMNVDGSKREDGEIKSELQFIQMYDTIADCLTNQDSYVIGFDVLHDVQNINQACERYKTPPLTFDFFDVQKLYQHLFPKSNQPRLEQCVNALGITEQFQYHTSESDAYATAKVMQKLCERTNMTVGQLIEQYPQFGGHAETYMASYWAEGKARTMQNSSVDLFKIRLDFPLLYFKKKIGAIREDGIRDGVCIFYDVLLDKLFKDRHPHKDSVTQVREFSPLFSQLGKLIGQGKARLRERERAFYEAQEPLIIRKYFVSYECVGTINNCLLSIRHGNKYLKQVSDENKYVKMVLESKVDPNQMIRRFYTGETFEQTMRKNAKWNYGDKNNEIVLDDVPAEEVQLLDGDAMYLPRAYAGVLTGKFSDNDIVACSKEHMDFASAQHVVDIESLNLADKSIKLVVQNTDGVFGFIPTIHKVKFPMFNCTYELPLLIKRQLSDEIFNK